MKIVVLDGAALNPGDLSNMRYIPARIRRKKPCSELAAAKSC